jgi:hypothetical protein
MVGLLAIAIAVAAGVRFPAADARAWWLGAGAITGLCAWSLLSAIWSGAPGRAVSGFDQVAPYLSAFVLGGLVVRDLGDAERVLRWIIASLVAVAACGLMSRLLPTVWPIPSDTFLPRLSYPVGYWNSMGLIAALAYCGCFAILAEEVSAGGRRDLAAAALPVCAGALYFSFSRAAIAVVLFGIVVLMAVARPGGARAALAASIPAAVVIGVALLLRGVSSSSPASPAAAREGAVLAVLELLAIATSIRLARMSSAWRIRWPVRLLMGLGVVAAIAAVAVMMLNSSTRPSWYDNRTRLLHVGDAYRTTIWELGWRAFHEHPVTGEGAGTFELAWLRIRPVPVDVHYQHNVLLDVLGELGLVGIALLAVAIVSGCGRILRLAPRSPGAAAACVLMAMWLLGSAVDYHWRVPAATIWLWATLGAFASAETGRVVWGARPRRALVVGLVAVTVVPATMAISEVLLRKGAAAVDARDPAAGERWGHYAGVIAPYRAGPGLLESYVWLTRGNAAKAREAAAETERLDPDGWEAPYLQAAATSWLGQDPRGLMHRAQVRNPNGYSIITARQDLAYGRPVRPVFGGAVRVDGWF